MQEQPIPTVICSTLTADKSEMALEALAAGAVAVVGVGMEAGGSVGFADGVVPPSNAPSPRPKAGFAMREEWRRGVGMSTQ